MMKRFNGKAIALGGALLLSGLSCSGNSKDTNKPNPPTGPGLETVGLSEAALDRTVDPCVDFFQYACGGWLANTKMPADQPRWGRFSEVAKRNYKELKRLLEQAAKSGDKAQEHEAKAGAFYASCTDEASLEKNAKGAIRQMLMIPGALAKKTDLGRVLSQIHRFGVDAIFKYDIDQDFNDPNLVIAYLYQGGLGLPDRDYYLNKDKRSETIRAAYQAHVKRMFALVDVNDADSTTAAANVVAVETALATLHKTRVEMRDVKGLYNRVTPAELGNKTRSIDWAAYYSGLATQISRTSPSRHQRCSTSSTMW